MSSVNERPVNRWLYVVLFLVISVTAVIAGLWFFNNQKKELLQSSTKELSTIADLKARQIVLWRNERLADGYFLSHNYFLNQQFCQFLAFGKNQEIKKSLLHELRILTEAYEYRSALVVDENLNVKLFFPAADTVIGDYLKSRLPGYFNNGEVVLTDIHHTGRVSFTHLDLIIPIINNTRGDKKPSGLMVLRIDPQTTLYPFLTSWPVTSRTAEALLVRPEGDEVVYLTELRHVNSSGSFMRRSLTQENLAASMAVNGIKESTRAVDYRGIPVIAAMRKVPESPWYIIAKVDREEVFSGMKRQVINLVIIEILFILAAGAILVIIARNQRVKFYREKFEAEQNRMALVRHFDYILKFANDIIMLTDSDFNIVEANDKAIETYQFPREELIGMNISNLRAGISAGKFLDDIKIINDSGHRTFEAVHKKKNGSEFPIEISARVVDIEGRKYYQSISRDISERKKSEEALRTSEERFRKIFEDSPFGMAMTSKDLSILKVNSAFCAMTGYNEPELIGMTFKNFTCPDDIARDEISILKLVAREIPIYRTEKRYYRKDGTIIWGSTTVSLIRNQRSEVELFFAMIEDITSRKVAESELAKSFSLQKATLESTADGILVVNSNGRIVQYNQKFADMWRIPESVLKTMMDEAALNFVMDQLKDPEKFISKVNQLYSEENAVTSDQIEFKDGRYFERYSQPQKLDGKTVGRVWSFRDITLKKKAEYDLIAAKEKAEEGDRLKTAFLHNVSHEIRTPMNAILGFSNLMNESGVTESERKQYTEIILQSGNQLLSIINDIVDLASIESGQVKLNLAEINLNAKLRALSEQYSYSEKTRKITLSLTTPLKQKDSEIITDGTKLIQIVSNLINNAFKFTKKGKIEFGYELKEMNLEFFVKDTGIGIPPEHQLKIFDRFYQVDNAASRQYSGTGLGLSICKAYVELLGGRIWVESAPDEGSAFYFTVPYKKKMA